MHQTLHFPQNKNQNNAFNQLILKYDISVKSNRASFIARILPVFLTVMYTFCIGSFSLTAQNIWNGNTNNDWATMTNWSTGAVPLATEDVVIPNVSPNPQPTISAGTSAVANSIHVQTSAALTIANTGILTVYGNKVFPGFQVFAFFNQGLVENSGQIILGSTSSAGYHGLDNRGTFHNYLGGELKIDNTTQAGIFNGGTFTNAAMITLGANNSLGSFGIFNGANFNNNAGGDIKIDNANATGLWNFTGTFNNEAKFTIGANNNVGGYGFYNTATFNNNAGGDFKIDRSLLVGLYNVTGTLNNAAKITIGANNSVGEIGLQNTNIINNNIGGEINVDNATIKGLQNVSIFNNYAKITIGNVASVGSIAIENIFTFSNSGCGALINLGSNAVITNSATFTNSGNIIERASSNSNISSNSGLVQNLNGGTFTITTNTGLLTTLAGEIWTGCVSSDWATPSNWSSVSVPTTDDNLSIPNVTNNPVISAGTLALAKSVLINAGSLLTIDATGSLTINSSAVHGLDNYGSVENNGSIIVGSSSSIGAIGIVHRNGGTFNNKPGGDIQIERTLGSQAFYSVGLVNNEGTIEIGSNAAVSGEGIRLEGNTFNNKPGGNIQIDSTGSNAIRLVNSGTVFNNEDIINIGSKSGIRGIGIRNDSGSTFNNEVGADIKINRVGIFNTSVLGGIRNSGVFHNDGKITIGNGLLLYAQDGILNFGGSFINSVSGIVSIAKPWGNGIWNSSGSFQNAGKIMISNIFYFEDGEFSTGILSTASFTNSVGAEIHIDAVANAITNTNAFTNEGLIQIGENETLTGSGIANIQGAAAVFNNNAGGNISIKQTAVSGITNETPCSIINYGTVNIGTLSSPGNDNVNNAGLFWNNGTVAPMDPFTNTGTYKGIGTINGNLVNSGQFNPGN